VGYYHSSARRLLQQSPSSDTRARHPKRAPDRTLFTTFSAAGDALGGSMGGGGAEIHSGSMQGHRDSHWFDVLAAFEDDVTTPLESYPNAFFFRNFPHFNGV
jgi:hypothetical protein